MAASFIFTPAYAEALYHDLKRANTETAKKERFLQYLSVVYAGDANAQKIISQMSLGAEQIIVNIPRARGIGKGFADTQTETVIIEWEKDLNRTGEHAIEQLAEYLVGNWRSGQEYHFRLIATDGIRWRLYAPEWSELAAGEFNLRNLKLREVNRFDLSPEKYDEFPFFLDEILFVTAAKVATLERIQGDFGDTSSTFINSMRVLTTCCSAIETQSELQVAYEQWRKFLSIAYGRFDDSPTMFLVHTYLSVFAKLIAYAFVTQKHAQDTDTIRSILNGKEFEKLNVERFVEDDFFHWVTSEPHFTDLKPMFRELNQQIADYEFKAVREDVLKGVYQELIDLDTRHALGEYYTPDWLCEKIVAEFPLSPEFKVLDPACGSGSFLRAVVARLRREHPRMGADNITSNVVGIDIHPLSVQIAKTTLLLSLGDLINKARTPVTLHVYLANSLFVPHETAGLFKSNFQMTVDNSHYTLDISGISGPEDFDKIISFCDDIVGRYPQIIDKAKFVSFAENVMPKRHSKTLAHDLYDVYKAMKIARDEGRDSIWKFILQNSYKPVFLRNTFHIVVGNPPWLTYSSVTNADYQESLLKLSNRYNVTPERRVNMPHLEIAAIFLAHSVNYFLREEGGIIAFVLPRSFMTADQHSNTRQGDVKRVQLTKVWDLKDVYPLFRVPSCVLFGKRAEEGKRHSFPEKGLQGYAVSGRLPRPQMHLEEADSRLTFTQTQWYYSSLHSGKGRSRSAITRIPVTGLKGKNAYEARTTQGATIVPRNFYFVDLDQEVPEGDWKGRVIHVRTSVLPDAKKPWKDILLSGRIEGDFLYRTALARNILPFVLVNPPLVVLPVTERGGTFSLHNSEQLFGLGAKFTSLWFQKAEKEWDKHKTEKAENAGMTLLKRLDFQRGITVQDPEAPFLVLYTSSGQDATSTVVDTRQFDTTFIVDHKAYWCKTRTRQEADYLCAYINSGYANNAIKEFQSTGLFGPRDIHKLIVKLPYPKFDPSDKHHLRVAELGKYCASVVSKYINLEECQNLDPRSLGRLRSKIRVKLQAELDEIDIIVEMLSTAKMDVVIEAAKKKKQQQRIGGLFEFIE